MTRSRHPNRRPSETAELEYEGARYAVTIGFYLDGRPGEVFTGNAKVGSGVEAVLDDAAILISLLLQNGVEPAALAETMGRLGDGTAPASIIGAIVDRLAELQVTEAAWQDR
jgi:hypothetical protein